MQRIKIVLSSSQLTPGTGFIEMSKTTDFHVAVIAMKDFSNMAHL